MQILKAQKGMYSCACDRPSLLTDEFYSIDSVSEYWNLRCDCANTKVDPGIYCGTYDHHIV